MSRRRRQYLIDLIEDSSRKNATRFKRGAPHLATQLARSQRKADAAEITRLVLPASRGRLIG